MDDLLFFIHYNIFYKGKADISSYLASDLRELRVCWLRHTDLKKPQKFEGERDAASCYHGN